MNKPATPQSPPSPAAGNSDAPNKPFIVFPRKNTKISIYAYGIMLSREKFFYKPSALNQQPCCVTRNHHSSNKA